MGVLSNDDDFCEQYFETIVFILQYLVEQSHVLSKEYVVMKDKIKDQEERFKLPTLSCQERCALEIEINSTKQSYEAKQKLVELTFEIFLVLNQFLADRDSEDTQASRLFKVFRNHRETLIECIYESVENPVLASTLFEQNEQFVSQIF
mmetsp:Transcript_20545/g.31275  ORF Transcript_20545/g.31275 Transcript_20545/m.31275 type:complete len:149 (-) Transcript_20545:3173-3619(-)